MLVTVSMFFTLMAVAQNAVPKVEILKDEKMVTAKPNEKPANMVESKKPIAPAEAPAFKGSTIQAGEAATNDIKPGEPYNKQSASAYKPLPQVAYGNPPLQPDIKNNNAGSLPKNNTAPAKAEVIKLGPAIAIAEKQN